MCFLFVWFGYISINEIKVLYCVVVALHKPNEKSISHLTRVKLCVLLRSKHNFFSDWIRLCASCCFLCFVSSFTSMLWLTWCVQTSPKYFTLMCVQQRTTYEKEHWWELKSCCYFVNIICFDFIQPTFSN